MWSMHRVSIRERHIVVNIGMYGLENLGEAEGNTFCYLDKLILIDVVDGCQH